MSAEEEYINSLSHLDYLREQNIFNSLRKGKKCSYKDLSKRLVKR